MWEAVTGCVTIEHQNVFLFPIDINDVGLIFLPLVPLILTGDLGRFQGSDGYVGA